MRLLTVGEARERFSEARLGFMGVTHALSAVTVAGVAIGLFPRVVTNLWDAPTLVLVLGFVASVAGWSMVPDLDNTSARAISDLGPVGKVLSFLFRESSSFVQGRRRSMIAGLTISLTLTVDCGTLLRAR